jgi:hypothetical protein
MAALARSVVTLRIGGDDLNPSELSQLLGATPTFACIKGEPRKLGGKSIARTGQWNLDATNTEPADLDAQVNEILAKLPSDLDVWRMLCARFAIDLFCGWFMNESNEGLEISAETLSALGDRGVKLGIDLYAPTLE